MGRQPSVGLELRSLLDTEMKQFAYGVLVICAAIATGCRDSHDHNHDHEDKTAQITVWTDRYELFAEHKAPVLNKPTRFVTHVSAVRTGEPRTQGPIKFLLRQGDSSFEHPQAAPERPGIYIPAITFPKTGDWQTTVLIPTDGADAKVELGMVRVYADDHAAAHAGFPEPPEGISFLKEQQWKIRSITEPVGKRRLIERVRLPAVVSPKPGAIAQVTVPISGRLQPMTNSPLPKVGDKVKAGDVLALLQPSFSELGARFVEAQAEVTRAKLELEQAEVTLKRTQQLAAAQARTERELQDTQFAHKAAQARYEAAVALQATFRQASSAVLGEFTNQFSIPLTAPISGTIVAQASVAVGEYLPAEKSVFTILDGAEVFIEAHVSEMDVANLSEVGGATYELPAQPGRFEPITEGGRGRLISVGIQVDSATHTVPVVYEVANPDLRLRVGQLLSLYVESRRVEDDLALPESAIVDEAGQPVAFVQVSGETFEKRELILGIRDGNWVQVISGLKEGERVAVKGAGAIRLASVSNVIPAHGHAH
jgi:membrane fusion protein, heavy metal efflux system